MKILLSPYLITLSLSTGLLSEPLKPEEQWRPGVGRDISKYKPKQPQVNAVTRKSRSSLGINESDEQVRYSTEGCGKEGPAKKIPDGNLAEEGQFPWAAALFIDGAWFCAGSLISDGHILTSAHCLSDASFIDILLGTSQLPDGANSIQMTSSEYVIHPDYDWSTMYSDIAIVKLPSKLDFTDFIAPICLPPYEDIAYEGLPVTVLGWGNEGLDYKETMIISDGFCDTIYGTIEDTGCIDETCSGSGAPVMSKVSQKNGEAGDVWRQDGILSFGSSVGCGVGYPEDFTRVEAHVQWILDETGIVL